MTTNFLFSVDVEDFPVILEGKETYARQVDKLVGQYLDFLDQCNSKATFFVLGQVAKTDPDVVKMIVDRGHEVGCHGYDHIPLNKHTQESFAEDIDKALEALAQAGAKNVMGYRAPFLSITPKTSWA